jgi:arabinogalactan oligomer/maltooligosaccharide transport system substrate-binding protein
MDRGVARVAPPSRLDAEERHAMTNEHGREKLLRRALRARSDRRKIIRSGAALGLGASAIGALTARSAGAQGTPAAYQPQGPRVDQLVLWTRSTPDAPNNTEWQNLTNVAAAYEEAVGTPVELVSVPDADFRTRMSVAAPAGEGPDVFGPVAHDWLGEFAIQGIAMEIPESALDNPDDFVQTGLDLSMVDGVLYALPVFIESVALLYNKDMVPEPPQTWEELVQIATDLTEGDVYGFGFPLLEQYHEGAFFMGFGSYIFEHDATGFDTENIGLNNPSGVEAAKFLRDMYHDQNPPMPEVAIDRANMHTVQEGMMEAGQLAMTINGPWREAPLTEAGINYGVAILPTLPNGEAMRPFVGVQAFLANAFSEQQEAALDFLRFATSTESVVELYKGFIKVPVRQSALQDPSLQENAHLAIWAEQASMGEAMPNIPAMGQVWTPWGAAMDAIIPPNAPDDEVQQYLDDAVAQIREAIERTQG